MSKSEQTRISSLRDTTEKHPYKTSIIVPCYNAKPWLDECLQSLVDQTLQKIEIICVNDGSTDGTGARLDEWQAQYTDKIKVIHQENNGQSNARNAGMAIAQGECIGFVDSDDVVDVCMYNKLYKVLTDNNADVVKCDYLEFIKKISPSKVKSNKIIFKENLLDILIENPTVWTGLYSNKFLQQYKIQFVPNLIGEDIIFQFDSLINTSKFITIQQQLYFYRKQRENQLTSLLGKEIYDIFKVFEYLHNKIAHIKLDNLKLIKNIIIRKQISMFFYYTCKIKGKYKKDFLFKAVRFIFEKNKIYDIYNTMLFTRYRNPVSYLFAPIVVILFHCCYLWQKISVKRLKQYFTKS